jgi:preprotein translocase subunit YajC
LNILHAQNNVQSGSGILGFVPIVLIGLIFYLFILRPQTKQRKEHENALSNLKKGDKIITRGGLYGKIVNFQGKNDSKVTIDAGSGVKFNIARSYITGLANNSENEKPDKNNKI